MLREIEAPVSSAAPDAGSELEKLRQEVTYLKELLASEDVALTAKEESLALYRRVETPKTTEGNEAAASGPGDAAPSKHCPTK